MLCLYFTVSDNSTWSNTVQFQSDQKNNKKKKLLKLFTVFPIRSMPQDLSKINLFYSFVLLWLSPLTPLSLSPVCWKFFMCVGDGVRRHPSYLSFSALGRKTEQWYHRLSQWFYEFFFVLLGRQTCPKRFPTAKESLRGSWQATVTWLCCFSQETADKETTGCPGTPPPPTSDWTKTIPWITRDSEMWGRSQEISVCFASVSTQGLRVVRLLISAHFGSPISSPGEVTGRHLRIIVSWCCLRLSPFYMRPLSRRILAFIMIDMAQTRRPVTGNRQC